MLLAYKSASLSTDPSSDSNEFRGGESEHGKREQLNEIKRDSKFEGEGKTIKKMRTRGGDKKKKQQLRGPLRRIRKKKKRNHPKQKINRLQSKFVLVGRRWNGIQIRGIILHIILEPDTFFVCVDVFLFQTS